MMCVSCLSICEFIFVLSCICVVLVNASSVVCGCPGCVVVLYYGFGSNNLVLNLDCGSMCVVVFVVPML